MDTLQEITDEKAALDARLAAISTQVDSLEYTLLPGAGQARILLQRDIMKSYSDVLGERIRNFNEDETTGEEKQEGVLA